MKNLKTNDVIIRKFKKEDIDIIYNNFNLYDSISNMTNINFGESKKQAQLIVKSAMVEYYTEEPIWALEYRQTKDLFGFIKIDNYSYKNKICNISWAMTDKYYDMNLMTQALDRVIKYLFDKKQIELIECSYYDQNKEIDKILDNVGMKKEAVLKSRRINTKTRKKEDYVIYSISINDFHSCKCC